MAKEVWECPACHMGMYPKDIKRDPGTAWQCKDCGYVDQARKSKATDLQPVGDDEDDAFKRDTDKGAAELIRKDGKTMSSAEIARKYGFSLSFVKEVLGGDNKRPGHPEIKPVGDAAITALYSSEHATAVYKKAKELGFQAKLGGRDKRTIQVGRFDGSGPEEDKAWKVLRTFAATGSVQFG